MTNEIANVPSKQDLLRLAIYTHAAWNTNTPAAVRRMLATRYGVDVDETDIEIMCVRIKRELGPRLDRAVEGVDHV